MKAMWHQWSRLCLPEGVLYRKFWSADGLSISLQLVAPYQCRMKFILLAHENMTGIHLAGDAQKLKSKGEAIGQAGQRTFVVFYAAAGRASSTILGHRHVSLSRSRCLSENLSREFP